DETVARELALSALAEITPAATIGTFVDSSVNDDDVLTLRFTNRLSGYPNWFWTVSLAQIVDAQPSVLEVELLPGDGSLIAPEWVPWAERLADYQAAQALLAAEGIVVEDLEEDDDSDEELDDVDDLDASDFDNDGSPILHSGDVDGVDIDELDEASDADDDDSGDELDDDDDDSDESDDDSD